MEKLLIVVGLTSWGHMEEVAIVTLIQRNLILMTLITNCEIKAESAIKKLFRGWFLLGGVNRGFTVSIMLQL